MRLADEVPAVTGGGERSAQTFPAEALRKIAAVVAYAVRKADAGTIRGIFDILQLLEPYFVTWFADYAQPETLDEMAGIQAKIAANPLLDLVTLRKLDAWSAYVEIIGMQARQPKSRPRASASQRRHHPSWGSLRADEPPHSALPARPASTPRRSLPPVAAP